MEVSGQYHASAALAPGKNSGINYRIFRYITRTPNFFDIPFDVQIMRMTYFLIDNAYDAN